jgi:hypothetical protein
MLAVRTEQRFVACHGEPIARLSTKAHSAFGIRGLHPLATAVGGVRATQSLNAEFPVRLPRLTSSSTLEASSARALAGGC